MFTVRWRGDAPRHPQKPSSLAVLLPLAMTILSGIVPSHAEGAANAINTDKGDKTDTEELFGFVEGSDIGQVGSREFEADSIGRFGKGTGTFAASASEFEVKYTALRNFRISAAATLAAYDIAGVSAMDDRRRAAVQSVSFDARFRLLERDHAPFGLTLSVQPHWGFVDETSGASLEHFGWRGLLLADRALVPDRLVGALNLLFDTDRTRVLPDRQVLQEPMLGVGSALAVAVLPGLWLGGELRYLRSYSGAGLDALSGEALYAGPTLYSRLGKSGWLSATLNAQVSGRAVGAPGALDLTNFERYQARLHVGFEF